MDDNTLTINDTLGTSILARKCSFVCCFLTIIWLVGGKHHVISMNTKYRLHKSNFIDFPSKSSSNEDAHKRDQIICLIDQRKISNLNNDIFIESILKTRFSVLKFVALYDSIL
ncbi:hypothetical protein RF11_01956 [Thelohanellus kitauei]|uniref:Uncharacterized protein n=1 Tax=Thelohanellus kitauei TaxID=669202 RepID=A0A0C2MUV3_THEKT|nr:hypothetical protein RF11_01956 [Thelohanellus kitauei]